MNIFKKLNLALLCVLLASSQVNAWFEAEHEGRQLSGKEGFAKKFIPDDLYKSWYRESIAKHAEEVENSARLAKENADKQEADRQAQETQTLLARKNDSNNYFIAKQKHQRALEKNNYTYNKNIFDLEAAKTIAARQIQRHLAHVGTFVDPDFKPYEISPQIIDLLKKIKQDYLNDSLDEKDMNFKKQMFDRIYNDIEQDLINYQARLNQLHEQNYNPEKKLTTSEKIILLNEIIPGITLFNDQEQDELVKYLTGTINR